MKIARIAAITILVLTGSVIWQNQSAYAQQSAPAWSPAKSLNMYAYPKKGQNADQQLKDESECYGSAKTQTGIDPQAATAPTKSAEQKAAEQKAAADAASAPKGGRLKGAAGGAAGGAAIGAIAGDAGEGAAIGAVAGTMAGGAKQRRANKAAKEQAAANTAAAQKQEEQQAKQATAQNLDTFKRAFSACMDAKDYSVK